MAKLTTDHIQPIAQSILASATRYKPNLSVTDPDDPRYVVGAEGMADKIAKAQQTAAAAKSLADQADGNALDALEMASAAQTTADTAQTAAATAQTTADNAKTAAATAQTTADNAKTAAATAQTTADNAKTAAATAQTTAEIQSDWEISDANDSGFIANKPFYETHIHTNEYSITLPSTSSLLPGYDDVYYGEKTIGIAIDSGETYYITSLDVHSTVKDVKKAGVYQYGCALGNTQILYELGVIDDETSTGGCPVVDTGEDWAVVSWKTVGLTQSYSRGKKTKFNTTIYLCEIDLKRLDAKFLPEEITATNILLSSSTEGSTKKFTLSVDDDGNLTTTAVAE